MKTHAPRTDRGFSLMELMVVIMILGILAVVVQKNVWPILDRAKQKTAMTDIHTLVDAVGLYKLENGKLPDNLEVLIQPDPKHNNEAYIQQESVPVDPWGNMYDYKKEGSKFTITCFGADGLPNGEGADEDIDSKTMNHTKK